ncbi:hypothetical protein CCH79_00000603 [Gambusia affinis]|uniref:Ras-associating domain-containing protein n=1 Tax=Gambusia affinis TaxID=33528 RepID=A0A315W6D2_GAMAF|nr:hypothetical protein CCH79_00000603 [Gambusia affinis]
MGDLAEVVAMATISSLLVSEPQGGLCVRRAGRLDTEAETHLKQKGFSFPQQRKCLRFVFSLFWGGEPPLPVFVFLFLNISDSITLPSHDLEFHGVMRFYFQDRVAGNFATKCIRVSSTATTQDVIETLAEKFRPDMRMLSSPKYSLYEVHVSGEERQLDLDEKPLVVQLNWNKDDREGRFVLKNENDVLPKKSQSNGPEKEKDGVIQNFKRTLSKKEKKEKKKREKEFARIPDGDEQILSREDGENNRLAAEVYKDMPETSFTRTISNPEVVMKRRRQQKLEKRMQEFMSSDGRPESGGTLKIYADSLKPNIPYKTILMSTRDTADFAVVEALEKYGLEKENPREYCIARQEEKTGKEVILDDLDCPLQILRDWPADRGAMVFQLKKRPPDYQPRKGRKDDKGLRGKDGSMPPEKLPYLVELSPGRGNHYAYYAYRHQEDGSDSRDKPKLYRLQHSITEVGSDCTEDGAIQLLGPGILPHHCNLMHSEGMVTVTPHGHDADTFVDGQRITETTVLRSGSTLQFGSAHVFKFVDPMVDQGGKRDPNGAMRSRHKSGSVPETTFDLRGDVLSGAPLPTSKSSGKLEMERGMVKPMIRGEQQDSSLKSSRGFLTLLSVRLNRSQDLSADRTELTLPASIDFRENSEDTFLSAIINYTNSSTVHFKLSPTYVLYMACRYVLSPTYRPDMSPSERTHKVIAIVNKMVSMMEGVIQEIAEGDQDTCNTISVDERQVVTSDLLHLICFVCLFGNSLNMFICVSNLRDAAQVPVLLDEVQQLGGVGHPESQCSRDVLLFLEMHRSQPQTQTDRKKNMKRKLLALQAAGQDVSGKKQREIHASNAPSLRREEDWSLLSHRGAKQNVSTAFPTQFNMKVTSPFPSNTHNDKRHQTRSGLNSVHTASNEENINKRIYSNPPGYGKNEIMLEYLVHCLQADLNNYMPAFLDDPEEHNPQRPKIGNFKEKLK